MNEIILIPNNLVKFMGEENYRKFVDEIENKFRKQFNKSTGFFLVAQQLEKTDIFK